MKNQTTAIARKVKSPRNVLNLGVVYSGDNGRLVCAHCAGYCAKTTGRDLSGQKMEALTQEDADEWMQLMGADLACELGCTVHKPRPGVSYSHAAARAMFKSDAYLNAVSVATAIES